MSARRVHYAAQMDDHTRCGRSVYFPGVGVTLPEVSTDWSQVDCLRCWRKDGGTE